MKRLFFVLFFAVAVFAKTKDFVREYEYFASEFDSRVTARQNASDRVRALLLQEIGQVVIAEQRMETASSHNKFIYDNYTEKITGITAAVTQMVILDEVWTGTRFFIRARITVDPSEVSKRANEILLNHQEMKALQDKNVEITRQVERLNSELSRVRTRAQATETFLFGEINEYKLKANEHLSRITQLTRRNEELSQRHRIEIEVFKVEIENYKIEAFRRDSIIASLNAAISELRKELATAKASGRQTTQAPQQQVVVKREDNSENLIRITTEPSGALIHANDRYIGRTPFSYANPPHGQISVRVRLPGYKQHTWNINYDGGRQVLRKVLEKSPQ